MFDVIIISNLNVCFFANVQGFILSSYLTMIFFSFVILLKVDDPTGGVEKLAVDLELVWYEQRLFFSNPDHKISKMRKLRVQWTHESVDHHLFMSFISDQQDRSRRCQYIQSIDTF